MIRRPPRSTLDRSSAASDVYKRQLLPLSYVNARILTPGIASLTAQGVVSALSDGYTAVSYTHLRAHETVLDLVCRLLLEKKKKNTNNNTILHIQQIEKKTIDKQ